MFRVIAFAVALILINPNAALAEGRAPLGAALSTASIRRALTPLRAAGPSVAQAAPGKPPSHAARNGALVGAGIGLIVGVVGMKSAVNNCPTGRSCSTAGAGVPFAMIIGAGLGAIFGLCAR